MWKFIVRYTCRFDHDHSNQKKGARFDIPRPSTARSDHKSTLVPNVHDGFDDPVLILCSHPGRLNHPHHPLGYLHRTIALYVQVTWSNSLKTTPSKKNDFASIRATQDQRQLLPLIPNRRNRFPLGARSGSKTAAVNAQPHTLLPTMRMLLQGVRMFQRDRGASEAGRDSDRA